LMAYRQVPTSAIKIALARVPHDLVRRSAFLRELVVMSISYGVGRDVKLQLAPAHSHVLAR